jgi:hypothetical protein
MLFIFYL